MCAATGRRLVGCRPRRTTALSRASNPPSKPFARRRSSSLFPSLRLCRPRCFPYSPQHPSLSSPPPASFSSQEGRVRVCRDRKQHKCRLASCAAGWPSASAPRTVMQVRDRQTSRICRREMGARGVVGLRCSKPWGGSSRRSVRDGASAPPKRCPSLHAPRTAAALGPRGRSGG